MTEKGTLVFVGMVMVFCCIVVFILTFYSH